MKVKTAILLFCFAWTLVASRKHHKVHYKLKGKHHDDEPTETETKWHRFGVDLSKINIEPEKCKNNKIMPCNSFKQFGYCSNSFYAMLTDCPLACRFCAVPEKTETAGECEDKKWQCPVWAHEGDCLRFPQYMKENCKLSCMLCGEDSDDKLQFDNDTLCPTWGSVGYCHINEDVRKRCRHSCHVYKEKTPEQGLNPDYEDAFYYLPFYINLPYTSLKNPTPTIAPTEHPPSEEPLIPTLPPKYSTLPPTHAFTTPEAGEGLPTIQPGNETDESSEETPPAKGPPQEVTPEKEPTSEKPVEEVTPPTEQEPAQQEPPQPQQSQQQPPQQEPPQPQQSQQQPPQQEPPETQQEPPQTEPPQTEPPQPDQAPPNHPTLQSDGEQTPIPGKFRHAKHHHKHHHKQHGRHFTRKIKLHHKSHAKAKHHAKSHKKHTNKKIKSALRKLKHIIH